MIKILKYEKAGIGVGLVAAMIVIALLIVLPISALENQTAQNGGAPSAPSTPKSDFWVGTSGENSLLAPLASEAIDNLQAQKIPLIIDYTVPIRGIIGLTIDANVTGYTSVCTAWTLITNSAENRMCHGSVDCCNQLGMDPDWSEWNTALYLTRGANGVEETNLVTVQLTASAEPISQDTPASLAKSEVERFSVAIPTGNETFETSVQRIDGVQQLQGVYIELPDEGFAELASNVSIEVGELSQDTAKIGLPVSWHQQIRLSNDGPSSINYSLSLWNLGRQIGIDFLNDVTDFEMVIGENIISETSVAVLRLAGGEEKKIDLTYLTPAVMVEKSCFDINIDQLLPIDAIVTSSEIELNTPVETTCNVRIYHNTVTHYKDIQVDLEDIDPATVKSIYYVEGNSYLSHDNGIINVPSED